MKQFQIRGHYGSITSTLDKVSPTDWLFRPLSYYRVGTSETGISFVDPAGGPFTDVGTTLKSLNVKLPNRSIISIHQTDDGFLFKTVATRKKTIEKTD